MAEIGYRRARAEDLERTYEIFVTATNDLRAQRNLPLIPYDGNAPPRALAFRRHALAHDGSRFWVAGHDGALVGFGAATLREGLWYLAALHVLPDFQRRGIGRTLLERCLTPGNAAGAQTRIVISDSLNPDSNALYARYGMNQWVPLLALDGPVPPQVEVDDAIRAEPLRPNDRCFSALDSLDRTVLGVRRRVDHELWLAQPDLEGLLFHAGEQAVGYAYVSARGEIGPLAVHDSAVLPLVLARCLRRVQAAGAAEASFKFPSSCHAGLAYLLRLGFRYHNILLLDASQSFGRLENYFVSVGDALF